MEITSIIATGAIEAMMMTTIERGAAMAAHKPTKLEFVLLRGWHAWVAGAFLVAYVTADEDTYTQHVFSGYAVLAAIGVRLVAGLLAPRGSPWRIPRPSVAATVAWLSNRKGRHPLFAWFAALLLFIVGAAAATGALADGLTWLEGLHEGVAEISLWVVLGHTAFVFFMFGGRRLLALLAGKLANCRAGKLSKGTVQ